MITWWNLQIMEGAEEPIPAKIHVIEREGLPYRHITIECSSWAEAEKIRQQFLKEKESKE